MLTVVVVQLYVSCGNVLCLLPTSFEGSVPLCYLPCNRRLEPNDAQVESERQTQKEVGEAPGIRPSSPRKASSIRAKILRIFEVCTHRARPRICVKLRVTCARTSRTFGVPFGSVRAGATTCWPWKSATTRDGRCLKSDARFIYSRGRVAAGVQMCTYTRRATPCREARSECETYSREFRSKRARSTFGSRKSSLHSVKI